MRSFKRCMWRKGPGAVPKALGAVCFALMMVLTIAQEDSCNSNPDFTSVEFSTSSLVCQQVWSSPNYVLRFSLDSSTGIFSAILSAQQVDQWVGFGFSKEGRMLGSSAMISYVNSSGGSPVIQRYYLGDYSSSGVQRDNTDSRLKLVGTPVAWNSGSTLYMAFQVDKNQSAASLDYHLYAIGPEKTLPTDGVLDKHLDKKAVQIDYSKGTISSVKDTIDKRRKAHGILNIFGWGIFLPIGAIIARYCRGWDPAWFYLHVTLQVSGYIFICAGLGTGLNVAGDVATDSVLRSHKSFGIFLFVLATLQILALVLRPNKESSSRRYWNWTHWWTGRIALFFAAVNIFVGIHAASAGNKWKAGYAIIIALEVIVVVALETLLWIRYLRQPPTMMQTSLSMARRQPTYPSDPGYPHTHPPPYRHEYMNDQ